MSNVATILCSKRPEELKRMISSFELDYIHDIFCCIDNDQPSPPILMYGILRNVNKQTIGEMLNHCFKFLSKKYEFIHITNDDVIYKTKYIHYCVNALVRNDDHVIAYGDDGVTNGDLASFPVIRRSFFDRLGHICPPFLQKYYMDYYWEIEAGNKLYVPEAKLIHLDGVKDYSEQYDIHNPIFTRDRLAMTKYIEDKENAKNLYR